MEYHVAEEKVKALQAKTERAVIEMKEKQRKWKAAKVDVRSARSKLGVVVNRYNEHAPSDGMIYDEDVEDSTSSDEEEEEVPGTTTEYETEDGDEDDDEDDDDSMYVDNAVPSSKANGKKKAHVKAEI